MAPADADAHVTVEIVYAPAARSVERVTLLVAPGTTLRQALDASGLLERHAEILSEGCRFGVWGRLATGAQLLRDGDRVEVYRPLIVDPKEARRLRYRAQRTRSQA